MYTQIVNATAEVLNLGFVPPHGLVLGPGDRFLVAGDLRTVLAEGLKRYSRATELRAMTAVEEEDLVRLTIVDDGAEVPILVRDGYFMIDSLYPGGPVYKWDDIEASGTKVPGFEDNQSYDDAISNVIAPPFKFNFLGHDCSAIRVCSNGFIEFDNTETSYQPRGLLPEDHSPSEMVAAFWSDLYMLENVSKVRYQAIGRTPNRRLVVTFFNLTGFESQANLTFQIAIYEGASGGVRCQYKTLVPGNPGFRLQEPIAIGLNRLVEGPPIGIGYLFMDQDQVDAASDFGLNEVAVGFRKIDTVSPWAR